MRRRPLVNSLAAGSWFGLTGHVFRWTRALSASCSGSVQLVRGVRGTFVKRDQDGAIVAVSREVTGEITEAVPDTAAELRLFLLGDGRDPGIAFRASDLEVVRVLEDLIDVLISKGVVRFTDLPEAAQSKLLQRKSMRRNSGQLTLVGDDDGLI